MITTPQIGQRVAFERGQGLAPVFGTIVGVHNVYNTGGTAITWQEDLEGRHCVHDATHPALRPVARTDKPTTPRHPLYLA